MWVLGDLNSSSCLHDILYLAGHLLSPEVYLLLGTTGLQIGEVNSQYCDIPAQHSPLPEVQGLPWGHLLNFWNVDFTSPGDTFATDPPLGCAYSLSAMRGLDFTWD